MKRMIFIFALLLVATGGFAGPSRTDNIVLPGSSLGNFHMIDTAGVYRSDQPRAKDFVAMEEYGIREVLNLRNYHNDYNEAKGTSLTLHHLRTRAGKITEEQLIEAMRIIRDRQGPIVIHCWHGSDRTGAVTATYRMVFQGIPADVAVYELTQGGYGYHRIYGNIPELIMTLDADSIRQALGIELPK